MMLGNRIIILLLFIIYVNINLTKQDGTNWNTKDFFKREHSLSKPYGGKID